MRSVSQAISPRGPNYLYSRTYCFHERMYDYGLVKYPPYRDLGPLELWFLHITVAGARLINQPPVDWRVKVTLNSKPSQDLGYRSI